MEQRERNQELLIELADFIETLSDKQPDLRRARHQNERAQLPQMFNMNAWNTQFKCGTVACIGGTLDAMLNRKADHIFHTFYMEDQARELGITQTQYDYLCEPYGVYWDSIKSQTAAKSLRLLARDDCPIELDKHFWINMQTHAPEIEIIPEPV